MFAVYHPMLFWLTDTCAGGTWSSDVDDGVWFGTIESAMDAIRSANIDIDHVIVCRVR